jgi:hypothetical protein
MNPVRQIKKSESVIIHHEEKCMHGWFLCLDDFCCPLCQSLPSPVSSMSPLLRLFLCSLPCFPSFKHPTSSPISSWCCSPLCGSTLLLYSKSLHCICICIQKVLTGDQLCSWHCHRPGGNGVNRTDQSLYDGGVYL